MTSRRWISVLCGLGLLGSVAGCGGGGGGGSGDSGGASASRTTAQTGAITAVGTTAAAGRTAARPAEGTTITVNGVAIRVTSATSISLNGDTGARPQDLEVGMVVQVACNVDADGGASADSVRYRRHVEGAVEAVDTTLNTLTVLGQTVWIDDLTVFDGTTLAELAVGNIVEVSGFFQADGSLLARRVEWEAASFDALPDKQLGLRGKIENFDPVAHTFTLEGLTVDFSTAVLENGLTLADGLWVEVKGTQAVSGGVFTASSIEGEDEEVGAPSCDDVELEGLITRFVSAADFDVDGHPVTTNAGTQYKNGTAADLAADAGVEVEGTLDAQGVLVAAEVSFRLARNVKIDAQVSSVDAVAGTLQVLGTTPGLTVTVDASTLLVDRGLDTAFTLADLAVGNWVSIRGFVRSGAVVAARLEREEAPDSSLVRLQGPVGDVDAAALTFTVLGLTVEAAGTASFGEKDGTELDAAAFFTALNGTNVLVRASGTLTPEGTLAAVKLSLDEPHEFEHDAEGHGSMDFEREHEGDHRMGGGHH